jgi:hypothetical protein
MGTEAIYEPVHLGVAWTSPVDVEERMLLTRRGIKLVWSQEGALGRQSFGALMVSVFFFLVFFPRPFFFLVLFFLVFFLSSSIDSSYVCPSCFYHAGQQDLNPKPETRNPKP